MESILGEAVTVMLPSQKQAIEEAARIRDEEIRRQIRRQEEKDSRIATAIIIIALVAIPMGIVYSKWGDISQKIEANRAVKEAKKVMLLGDDCVSKGEYSRAMYYYEDAKDLVRTYNSEKADELWRVVNRKLDEATSEKEKVDHEYEESLRKLKILLEADDDQFNRYSNECLDNMIKIYPDRDETVYYKKLRNGEFITLNHAK